jgi:serine/threonine protein kinase
MVAGGKTVAAGTPGYTPLEQWQMRTSAKSDVYALAATMHHLLTARDPRDRFSSFAELDLSVLRSLTSFAPLGEVRPDVRPALAALVDRCLDVDPRNRPTAAELKIELARLAPTGSRFFETARRWGPTIGDLIGAALASFFRSIFGRPTPPRPPTLRAVPPSPAPTESKPWLSIPCLACGGEGKTRDGQPCPVCGGRGTWWQAS